MSRLTYDELITGKVQTNGNQTLTLSDLSEWAPEATNHQVHLIKETATSGTAAVYVLWRGDTEYLPLLDDYGAAVVLNVAARRPYRFNGLIDGIQLRPTSITGGTGLYGARFSGWN